MICAANLQMNRPDVMKQGDVAFLSTEQKRDFSGDFQNNILFLSLKSR